jgi:hypothetical protein
MRIRVENTYSDGSCSVQFHDIDDMSLPDGYMTDLDVLWDELWQYTGDGSGEGMDAFYEVEILESVHPGLVGLTNEWC